MPSKTPKPQIDRVWPVAAIPGGEFQITGKGLMADASKPVVSLGEVEARLVVGSDNLLVARVPDDASIGELIVTNSTGASPQYTCEIGIQIADNLHPVASPAVDEFGNVYTTFSGSRGQKTPVAVYKLDLNYTLKPFVTDLMNATSLAFSPAGVLHVSSRFDGIVYQVNGAGDLSVYCEGMGTATGIAFDKNGNLFVGDRSGTIFKVSPERQIYVFATLEPSISAYHLAFDDDGNLYVTGPTTSSFDVIHKVSPEGVVTPFFRGLGRPQGMAFDEAGNLYCCASLAGRRGVVKITPEGKADLCVSGPGIVGLAFSPARAMIVATNNALYRIDAGIKGRKLF
jgi:sugar lactone lactonase YvrE